MERTKVSRRSAQNIVAVKAVEPYLLPLIPQGPSDESRREAVKGYAQFLRYRLEARDALVEVKP